MSYLNNFSEKHSLIFNENKVHESNLIETSKFRENSYSPPKKQLE